ncbi:MAG: hypothetical protein FWH06_05480 [Oscillospiraceae bacterium]|nr:hypothetical protein [Oscillospiraceae bacterium]
MDILLENGAAGAGVCEVGALRPFMTRRMSERMAALPFEPLCAIVGSFPFFTGEDNPSGAARGGMIAQFARAADYHMAVFRRVSAAAGAMSAAFQGARFHPLKNGWPLPIVEAARLAGVAFTGRHGLAIDGTYGSYIALSAVLCDSRLPLSQPLGYCNGCDGAPACESACPTGAISRDGERRVFDRERCISHITQNSDSARLETLRLTPYIWGCDICQQACPHNQNVPKTPLPEFLENVISRVRPSGLGGPSMPTDRHYSDRLHLLERNMRYTGDGNE